jgi:hypothetical protein
MTDRELLEAAARAVGVWRPLYAHPAPSVEPVAWRTFDGERGYDYRTYDENETYRDAFIARNGPSYRDWVEPLYLSPPDHREAMQMALESLDMACAKYGEVGGADTDWGRWDAAASALRAALGEKK